MIWVVDPPPDDSYVARFLSRTASWKQIGGRTFDIAIVGGGLAGLALARECAFNGYRTAIFEEFDWGGNLGSFLVSDRYYGKERISVENFFRLYGGSISSEIEQFRDQEQSKLQAKFKSSKFELKIFEGISKSHITRSVNSSRLMRELLVSALQEGAIGLNRARLESYAVDGDGSVVVGCKDLLNLKHYSLRCGVLVIAAGDKSFDIGNYNKAASILSQKDSPKHSQGTSGFLIWKGPVVRVSFRGRDPFFAAYKLLQRIARHTIYQKKITSLKNRPLPGAACPEASKNFLALLEQSWSENGFSANSGDLLPRLSLEVAARWGDRCRYLLEKKEWIKPVAGRFLFGEIVIAVEVEQAQDLSDLLERRFAIDRKTITTEDLVVLNGYFSA